MNKIAAKLQKLGQKAAAFKQVLDSAPGRAAELRETVLMTAGQLQQLRNDVQSNVTGLRADNDDRLAQALREINDSAETFLQAGYELVGVDMDLSPVHRLIVHLEKIESVSDTTLRSLLANNSGRPTIYALLSSLSKADSVTEKVHLSHLSFRELIVHVGPIPSVRICWRPEPESDATEMAAAPATIVGTRIPSTLPPTPPPLPEFSQSNYFEKRPAAVASTPIRVEISPKPVEPEPTPAAPTASPGLTGTVVVPESRPGGDWKSSALDRFKKMPDVSKYRR